MDRTAALEQIRAARVARGVSYEDLGKAIGTKDPTYLAAALHGQHRLSADEAEEAGGHHRRARRDRDGDDGDAAAHRLPAHHRPVQVPAHGAGRRVRRRARERCNELFGDGILSAIDCVVKLEKKGERGVLTIDAKFLHYKEY